MRLLDLKVSLLALSIAAIPSAACGDNVAQTDGGSGTSTGAQDSTVGLTEHPTTSPAETSAGSASSSSTGALDPCDEVHDGGLAIKDDTDLATLANIGRVTGEVFISFAERDQRDLAFLSCLHTIDGRLLIQENSVLESTEGLENLKSVSTLAVIGNPNLRVVSGFDALAEIAVFEFRNNPMAEVIRLDGIKSVKRIEIGSCAFTGGNANNLNLMELSGFGGLTTVESLYIDGNETLVSAGVLDALVANGAPQPSLFATVRFNPMLSEAAVHASLDVLEVPLSAREVCGNLEGELECYCPVG